VAPRGYAGVMSKNNVESNLNLQPNRVVTLAVILVGMIWFASMIWAFAYLDVDLGRAAMINLLSIIVQLILFAIAVVFVPFLWARAVINMFRMVAERRKDLGQEPFRSFRWNPFNVIAHPKLLTRRGLECRGILLRSIGWLSILILSVLAWNFIFEPFST